MECLRSMVQIVITNAHRVRILAITLYGSAVYTIMLLLVGAPIADTRRLVPDPSDAQNVEEQAY